MRVAIIGAGGHGQVVADILLRCREAGQPLELLGYLDDAPERQGQRALGLPVLGPLAQLASLGSPAVVIAVGDNRRRHTLAAQLVAQGTSFVSAIHPGAILAHDVAIAPGCMVCAGAILGPGVRLGAHCIINTAASVDHHCQLAELVHVAPGGRLGGAVTLATGVLVGIGATVLPQRRIGAWSTAGAGSLVARDLPDHVVALGVPARIRRKQQEP